MSYPTQSPGLDLKGFQQILEQAPVAMSILIGPEFIVHMANVRQMERWEKQKEEVIGQPLFDIFPEIRSQEFRNILSQVYQTGNAFEGKEIPVQYFRKGMFQTGYFNLTYEPFRNNYGTVEGIITVSVEVTDQVLARKKAEERGALSTHLQNNTRDTSFAGSIGLWHFDVATGKLTWSGEMHALYGIEEGNFDGTMERANSFVIPQDLPDVIMEISAFHTTSASDYQFRIRRNDGAVRNIQCCTMNVFDAAGQLQFVSGITIDVTEK